MFMRQEKIEPLLSDLFIFEMSKVRHQLPELKEVADKIDYLASRYRHAISKIEAAVEFNSLASLRSAALDFDDIIKGAVAMRDNLEIIITKARSAR